MQLALVKQHYLLTWLEYFFHFFLSIFLLFFGLRIICLCTFDEVDMALLTVQDNPSPNNSFRVPTLDSID